MARRVWAVLIPLVVGGCLRVAVFEWTDPSVISGDEGYYANVAANIASGRGHVYDGTGEGGAFLSLRPPLHAALLALVAAPETREGAGWAPSRHRWLALEVALGTVLVGLTAVLGTALFDPRTGLLAGLLAAVDPTLVAHSHYLWSETLFGVLLVGALASAVGVGNGGRAGLAVLTGLLFGLATLTREVAVPAAAVCAFWWIWIAPPPARRRAVGYGAVMAVAAAAVILPWTWRNYRLYERFVPVTTMGWYAMAEGNTFGSPTELKREFHAIHGDLQRQDFARRYALEHIREEQPGWIVRKTARSLSRFFEPDSMLLYKLRRGLYGDVRPFVARFVFVASQLVYVLGVTGAILGIASAFGGGRRLLPCLLLGTTLLLHIVSHATARYRVPWMPLLFVYAAAAAVGWRRVAELSVDRRWIAPAVAIVLFAIVCVPYFATAGAEALVRGGAATAAEVP